MAKGHSTRRLPVKGPATEKIPGRLSEGQKIAHAIIKTTADLDKLMEQRNIQQLDIDEYLTKILPEELKDLEDTIEGENPDDDDFREEYDDEEDDYKDYDEMRPDDPFEAEGRDRRHSQKYVAAVSFVEGLPVIRFLQLPQYDTNNTLVKNALLDRYELICKMASFIAETQKAYFMTYDEKKLNNLNQQDLVKNWMPDSERVSVEKGLRDFKKTRKLKKSDKETYDKERRKIEQPLKNYMIYVSRLLDALYFKIEELGTVPARFFIRRYGTKTRLTQEEKLAHAREFLKNCGTNLNQLEKAKGLAQFIEQKKGISVKLSNSKNEHDRYKQWKNLISRVEKEKEGE